MKKISSILIFLSLTAVSFAQTATIDSAYSVGRLDTSLDSHVAWSASGGANLLRATITDTLGTVTQIFGPSFVGVGSDDTTITITGLVPGSPYIITWHITDAITPDSMYYNDTTLAGPPGPPTIISLFATNVTYSSFDLFYFLNSGGPQGMWAFEASADSITWTTIVNSGFLTGVSMDSFQVAQVADTTVYYRLRFFTSLGSDTEYVNVTTPAAPAVAPTITSFYEFNVTQHAGNLRLATTLDSTGAFLIVELDSIDSTFTHSNSVFIGNHANPGSYVDSMAIPPILSPNKTYWARAIGTNNVGADTVIISFTTPAIVVVAPTITIDSTMFSSNGTTLTSRGLYNSGGDTTVQYWTEWAYQTDTTVATGGMMTGGTGGTNISYQSDVTIPTLDPTSDTLMVRAAIFNTGGINYSPFVMYIRVITTKVEEIMYSQLDLWSDVALFTVDGKFIREGKFSSKEECITMLPLSNTLFVAVHKKTGTSDRIIRME